MTLALPELILVALIIAFIWFEVWMIIDAYKNKKLSDTAKALWIIGILLFHPVIAIVYYFTTSTKKPK